ncbi:hypothetical protein Van01_44320 [Micromonospora andamanensis]|uniref:Uncharacterized protein n=1 Tax=Micromonospora andamanensis TaxID=1287068 RepID=A0ABQ4HZW8_9ACTN|nr:hypothetical protein Van01_44320 [Micromonospora andamanensis]
MRTGPVPFGTDGAAPATIARAAGCVAESKSHTFGPDCGDTTGSIPADGGTAASGAACTGSATRVDAAMNTDATPTLT